VQPRASHAPHDAAHASHDRHEASGK
jgi:hypothetical protein